MIIILLILGMFAIPHPSQQLHATLILKRDIHNNRHHGHDYDNNLIDTTRFIRSAGTMPNLAYQSMQQTKVKI